jgi:NADH-quinone oxidoreductase subunit H
LPECEQELVGGYHTEYAGMKLLLFLIAEFLHMVVSAFLIVILFFGGWHLWGLTGGGIDEPITWWTAILRVVVFVTKIMAVILFFMLVRWSWPRFRFDQLMTLAWKVMLPLGLVNLVAVAVLTEMTISAGVESPWIAVAWGWSVLVLGWIGAAMWVPLHDDNRPKTTAHEFDAEEQLVGR